MTSIKKILPTDVLSESMNKINDNFEALANSSGVSALIISKYKNELKNIIENFKTEFNVTDGEIYAIIERIQKSLDKTVTDVSTFQMLADQILARVEKIEVDSSGEIKKLAAQIKVMADEIKAYVNGAIGGIDLSSQLELFVRRYNLDGLEDLYESVARIKSELEKGGSDGDYEHLLAQLELLTRLCDSFRESIARLSALIESSDSDGYHSILAQLELLSREDSDIWEAIGRLKAEIDSSDSDGYNKLLSMLELYVKYDDVNGLREAIAKLETLIEGSDSDGYYELLSQLTLLTKRCNEFDLSLADLKALIEGSDSDGYYSILARLRLLSKQYDDIQEALAELKATIEGSDSDGYSKLLAQLELYVRSEMEGYKEALAKLTALIESSDSDGYYSILSRLNLLTKDTKAFREALADLQAKIDGSDSDGYYSMLAELELYVHDELGGVKTAQATMRTEIDEHEAAISTMVTKDVNGYIVSGVKLKGDQIVVEGGNFTVDPEGNVSVTGAITATSLTLGGDAKDTILDVIGDGEITVNARHVTGVDVEYIWWNSSTNPPTQNETGWKTTAGDAPEGNPYLWSRTKTTYSLGEGDGENKPSYSTPYWIQMGTDGKGITSIDEQYAQTNSPVDEPDNNEFDTTAPTWESGKYLWTRTIITYTDGTTTITTPICVTGPAGSSGYSVTNIEEQYANGGDSVTIPPESDWKNQTEPEKGMYFWRRWKTILSNGTQIPATGWNYECVSYTPVDGDTMYTWIKYANSANPSADDMQDDPEGMSYIGISYNNLTQESNSNPDCLNPDSYTWMKFRGDDGDSIDTQYSSDLSNWDSEFTDGDIWMRVKKSSAINWSSPTRIVGEKGDRGPDGKLSPYMDYTFNLSKHDTSSSATTPPTDLLNSTWSDSPLTKNSEYPYLWMKTQKMVGNSDNTNWDASGSATYVCLTGQKGDPGVLDDDIIEALEKWDPGNYLPATALSVGERDVITANGKTYKVTDITFEGITYSVAESDGVVYTDVGFGEDSNLDAANANNRNFTMISSDGLLQANNAIIYGTVYANGGQIGGITIQDNELKAKKFALDSNGTLTATDASISGNITATSGEIGGIKINSSGLESDGDNFSLSSEGVLTAKGANISGTITATSGKIGNVIIDNGALRSNNFTLSSDGVLTATNASISGNITATSGKIGNVTISDGALTNGDNFTLSSNGVLTAKGANISGVINATELHIGNSVAYNLDDLKGADGKDGKSAFRSAVDNGFKGTESEWVESLNGAPGAGYDNWLGESFSESITSGGLQLTGNLFVADRNGNITGGVMGGNDSTRNDIRFFAGSSSLNIEDATNEAVAEYMETAPFRVYEDGTLYASQGIFSGNLWVPYVHYSKLFDNPFYAVTSSTGDIIIGTSYSKYGYSKNVGSEEISNPKNGDWYKDSRGYVYIYVDDVNTTRDYDLSPGWYKATRQYNMYCADDRPYIVINPDADDDITIVIPSESHKLNGFTYHFLIMPGTSVAGGAAEKIPVKFRLHNYIDLFENCFMSRGTNSTPTIFKEFSTYGGHLEMTCISLEESLSLNRWVITQCTGGMNIKDLANSTSHNGTGGAFSPVYAYSKDYNADASNLIDKICADVETPLGPDPTTLYINTILD